jgi:hypothetical protein
MFSGVSVVILIATGHGVLVFLIPYIPILFNLCMVTRISACYFLAGYSIGIVQLQLTRRAYSFSVACVGKMNAVL